MLRIAALQKTTTLDFPGRLSAIVFTKGCNFRCPYCHNPALAKASGEAPLAVETVLDFLHQRRRILEGVVVTGGEATLHEGLADFCAAVRELGYSVKLDTNGSRPDMLKRLLQTNLLDYVAMDLKSDPACYAPELSAVDVGPQILESLRILAESGVEHEFRTTCVAPFVTVQTFPAMLEALHNTNAPLFLQAARLESGLLRPDFFSGGQGYALAGAEIEALRDMALARGLCCELRG